MGIKMMAENPECRHGCPRNHCKNMVVVPEQAPGRTCITPMDKLKETRQEIVFLLESQKLQNHQFAELIRSKDKCTQTQDTLTGTQ